MRELDDNKTVGAFAYLNEPAAKEPVDLMKVTGTLAAVGTARNASGQDMTCAGALSTDGKVRVAHFTGLMNMPEVKGYIDGCSDTVQAIIKEVRKMQSSDHEPYASFWPQHPVYPPAKADSVHAIGGAGGDYPVMQHTHRPMNAPATVRNIYPDGSPRPLTKLERETGGHEPSEGGAYESEKLVRWSILTRDEAHATFARCLDEALGDASLPVVAGADTTKITASMSDTREVSLLASREVLRFNLLAAIAQASQEAGAELRRWGAHDMAVLTFPAIESGIRATLSHRGVRLSVSDPVDRLGRLGTVAWQAAIGFPQAA